MKAYPSYEWVKAHGQMMAVGGMDLRDYFAGQAVIAIGCYVDDKKGIAKLAKDSYEIADALMKAREAK